MPTKRTLALIGLLLCPWPVASAQDDIDTSTIGQDAAFDEFVSWSEMGAAVYELDPAKLAEHAAKLAEAERKLGRVHKSGLSAVAVFRKALETATERKDTEALAQITQSINECEQLGADDRQTLVQLAELLRQTSAGSRAIDPAFLVDVESFSVDGFLYLWLVRDQLQFAKLTNHVDLLKRIETDVSKADDITSAQRDTLLKSIGEARELLRESPQSDMLRKLAAASRGKDSDTSGRANVMNAQANMMGKYVDLVKAAGDNALKWAEVENKIEELKQLKLKTKQQKAELYFYLRQLRTDRRRERLAARRAARDEREEKERYQTAEQVQLRWPTLLDGPPFQSAATRLRTCLLERTSSNSGVGSQNYADVWAETNTIKAILKDRIRELPTGVYVAISRFLNSLIAAAYRPLLKVEYDPIYRLVSADSTTAPTGDLVASVSSLAGNSRSAEPARLVSVFSMDPEAYALYVAFVKGIQSAKNAGDDESLAGLRAAATRTPLLVEQQTSYLLQKIDSKDGNDFQDFSFSDADPLWDVRESLARIAGLEPPLIPSGNAGVFDRDTRDDAFETLTYLVGSRVLEPTRVR